MSSSEKYQMNYPRFRQRYKEDDFIENEKDIIDNVRMEEGKSASKKGGQHTKGTAISFGFRRRSRGDGNNLSVTNYDLDSVHQRSKSAGPEQMRRRIIDDEERHQRVQSASSGRSTPRLAPPKKESASGIAVRTNRFGFRQPTNKYTDKVGDIYSSHSVSHFNQEKLHQQQQQQQQQQQLQHHLSSHPHHLHQEGNNTSRPGSKIMNVYPTPPSSKLRPSPVNNQPAYSHNINNNINNNITNNEISRKTGISSTTSSSSSSTGIPEPISKYTLHTSHLPLPQYAVRLNDSNSKIAKTVANQSRKVSTASKGSGGSHSGSGTEDSGISSQPGYIIDNENIHHHNLNHNQEIHGMDYLDGTSNNIRLTSHGHRPRNLRMVVSGKSFDVRDVDDDSTVTEISVIPLPKTFQTNVNLNTGLVRDRTTQYQRIVNKDNRFTESTTSMSTTSSEGYDEGLGEEKVFKDRSRTEKIPSIKSDFSPPSSDDPEYGHGEAMADEYSFSSSDECRSNTQHLKTISNAAKSGSLPKNTLRSVLLTIEDPAFAAAAAAATSTTLIDDETSPVDSLVDSLTASITQSDGQPSKKERIIEKPGDIVDDDSPGTPTNASNSLSLSEGREYFDDEIADQPGLTFDDTIQNQHDAHSGRTSRAINDNSQTLIESTPKIHPQQAKNVENSPIVCRRITRTGSVDTLSPCESITSDDLMLDYERSETSSYNETNRRLESSPALHEMDDTTIISELEAQGEEVMREWSSLLNTHPQHTNTHLTNNNLNHENNNPNNNNNNQPITESGIGSARNSRLISSRSSNDSPRTRQIASPFKPILSGNSQCLSLDSGDEGSPRLDRCNYQQDIVYIKTGLLKLMRVIQESEEKDLTRSETLNPFNNQMNGLFQNLNEENSMNDSNIQTNGGLNTTDELVDLRRQIVFLQGQLEDKDRAIQNLQHQVSKQQELINNTDSQSSSTSSTSSSKDISNAATQTEKIRPVSAGPSLLQGFSQDNSMGPLVSWSDTNNHQTSSTHQPLQSLVELSHNSNNSIQRKTNNQLSRLVKHRQEKTRNRQNENIEISLDDSSSTIRDNDNKSRELISNLNNNNKLILTNVLTECQVDKLYLPTVKKLSTTLIPRVIKN